MAEMYPVLPAYYGIDAVMRNIQQVLLDELGWLDDAFGRTERRERDYNGKKRRVQCVHKGATDMLANEYMEMSPDSEIGNFSFFVLRDPQQVDWKPNVRKMITQPYSLIFWFNIQKILTESGGRNIEVIKLQILHLLDRCRRKDSSIEVDTVYEDTQNIWRNVTEVEDLSMWHPYGGLRFDGTIKYREDCI